MICGSRHHDLPPVFVAGYPGDVGGADTECWHTARLWRRFGLQVSFIPTWRPTSRWHGRLEEAGCTTVRTSPARLHHVAGLRNAVVISFCNGNFLRSAHCFRNLGCKVVWINCMTWMFPQEREHYRHHGPFERYVFQSRYQQSQLEPELATFGVTPERCHHIRGPLCLDEFPFRPLPHRPGTPFVIGRISRPDRDKYAADTWSIYGRIPHPVKARLMAWDQRVEGKLGRPPSWAECLPVRAETSQEFFGKLHCMVQINGGAGENWPRSGLEAMASGVPVVVENRWGWREMIRHGQTGYLCDNADELVSCTARLARHEDHRLNIARRAREALEGELANPQTVWEQWRSLFEGLLE